ncbi:MAG: hypothetical protein Q4F31_06975 [Eubacteriales bacterium]|nr:hypothetical protein [Eubacteriales bacterium]
MNKSVSRSGRLTVVLAVLALVLLVASSVGIAHSYFTTYTTADGGHTVFAKSQIEIHEGVKNLSKSIQLENTGRHECWARVLVVYPEGYKVTKSSGTDWSEAADGSGYWYYNKILPAGATTPVALTVEIEVPDTVSDEDLQKQFNVVVIEECVPVLYNEDGTPKPADWSLKFEDELITRRG